MIWIYPLLPYEMQRRTALFPRPARSALVRVPTLSSFFRPKPAPSTMAFYSSERDGAAAASPAILADDVLDRQFALTDANERASTRNPGLLAFRRRAKTDFQMLHSAGWCVQHCKADVRQRQCLIQSLAPDRNR